MNGLSLLVVLASVGVISVGWEPTSTGKPAYTIRVEPLVVNQLGDGSAIESVVEKADRGLRKFRVVVGPKNGQTDRIGTATANEMDYGWRPNETGGIDYYVQISRERLESLARGVPLECEVHPDVLEIEKIYVFVGDTKLPREFPQGGGSSAGQPRDLSSYDSRGGVAPASGTQTNPAAARYGDPVNGTQANTQVNVSDLNRNNGYGVQTGQGGSSNNQTYGSQGYGPDPGTGTGYRDQGAGRYGDNMLQVPPLYGSRPTDNAYNGNQYITQQDQYNRQQAQQAYAPPLAQTAGLPQQQQYAAPPVAAIPVAVQQPANTAAATNPSLDALAAVLALQQKQLESNNKTSVETEAVPKSSKPLILTTLALFASIGANAYLGWLAWSFFWRFRDAASDLSRARSNAFPAGSVAGH